MEIFISLLHIWLELISFLHRIEDEIKKLKIYTNASENTVSNLVKSEIRANMRQMMWNVFQNEKIGRNTEK